MKKLIKGNNKGREWGRRSEGERKSPQLSFHLVKRTVSFSHLFFPTLFFPCVLENQLALHPPPYSSFPCLSISFYFCAALSPAFFFGLAAGCVIMLMGYPQDRKRRRWNKLVSSSVLALCLLFSFKQLQRGQYRGLVSTQHRPVGRKRSK